jgi:hypothetical protein
MGMLEKVRAGFFNEPIGVFWVGHLRHWVTFLKFDLDQRYAYFQFLVKAWKNFCQTKIEMSYSFQSRNVRFLGKRNVIFFLIERKCEKQVSHFFEDQTPAYKKGAVVGVFY